MFDWFMDNIFPVFAIGFIILVIGVFGLIIFDGVQDYRSEPQQIACRAKREDYIRRSFTTNVTCVPVLTKRDTITVLAR